MRMKFARNVEFLKTIVVVVCFHHTSNVSRQLVIVYNDHNDNDYRHLKLLSLYNDVNMMQSKFFFFDSSRQIYFNN
jgi:hypothetical protein